MSTQPFADILLTDPDAERRPTLAAFLNSRWPCTPLADLPPVGAAVSTILLAMSSDIEHAIGAVYKLKSAFPKANLGVISSQPLDQHLPRFFNAGATQFLTGTGARLEHELAWQVSAMISHDLSAGLESIFGPFHSKVSFVVRDRWERHNAIDKVVDFFTDPEVPGSVVDIHLALDEMLNNAFYHSFRDPDGHEKYTAETFDTLENEESVRIEIGRVGDFQIVSVRDTAGSLSVEKVTQSLARHLTMQGLMDEHGRGFFLMRSVSDGMLVRIQPKVSTEVTLVFGRHTSSLVKGLLVQETPRAD